MSDLKFRDGILEWPSELTGRGSSLDTWYLSPTNLCLDFHGDPANAELVVFSDGNHHMALQEALSRFQQKHNAGIFYMTTPPGVVRIMIEQGGVCLGNLRISAKPHILIGPDNFIQQMESLLPLGGRRPFMRSRGCALIVHKSNPKNITGIHDLLRNDIRIASSNPETETASYRVYRKTAINYLQSEMKDNREDGFFTLRDRRMVFSRRVHHREVPALVVSGRADVALVYYHLALRYARIFPHQVQMFPLDNSGTASKDVITHYHVALTTASGNHGQECFDYMCSPEVQEIYREHGLLASGT